MANKNLFGNSSSSSPARAMVQNHAGGKAYSLDKKELLAQIAATNCFNGTFYVSGEENLKLAKKAAQDLANDPEFIAKTAIYCREKSYMKDMPAFLLAVLASNGHTELFHKVFDRVIDNSKMLRNFVQIGRSGQAGRVLNMSRSSIRKAIDRWFKTKDAKYLLNATIGNEPSLSDIMKLARPRPEGAEREALYGYLANGMTKGVSKYGTKKTWYLNQMPEAIQEYEHFKRDPNGEDIPDLDFRLLDSVLTGDRMAEMWMQKAIDGSWNFVRMNLNNFQKYGAFKYPVVIESVVSKLTDKRQIERSKAYPYQIMTAYYNFDGPIEVKNALHEAMELCLDNVPKFEGTTYVAVDVSGSMESPITGNRPGSSSKMSCLDVAALFGSSILRVNKTAKLIPFSSNLYTTEFTGFDSVFSNSDKLKRLPHGGTDCSLPLQFLNSRDLRGDLVIYFSDNESWIDNRRSYGGNTIFQKSWEVFKSKNRNAKLVCVDLTPNDTTQVNSRKDVLLVGGFGDSVFDAISSFVQQTGDNKNHWVKTIESIEI